MEQSGQESSRKSFSLSNYLNRNRKKKEHKESKFGSFFKRKSTSSMSTEASKSEELTTSTTTPATPTTTTQVTTATQTAPAPAPVAAAPVPAASAAPVPVPAASAPAPAATLVTTAATSATPTPATSSTPAALPSATTPNSHVLAAEETQIKKREVRKAKATTEYTDNIDPDHWIPRSDRLIPLTGPHPLNAEPPLELLMQSGLHTSHDVHYIRNHGIVPKLEWDTHRIQVTGLVDTELTITMDELVAMPSFQAPVNITCDGIRRKELNSIKHTTGFHWGPGATGCANYTGVRLYDILQRCGVKPEAAFVRFVGADECPKGDYDVSLPLARVMDRTNDIMLAYKMNGELLTVDHGFPVRIIAPGIVGRRMVKWLKTIIVSDQESTSPYHRLLPPTIDPQSPEAGGWWGPEFQLYDMNVNSVISSPAHQEWLPVDKTDAKYTMRGYAYSGGGRKVARVEVTLDNGKTWTACRYKYPENAVQHGTKYWSWCHWEVDIPVWRLLNSKEVAVRAWDQSFSTQPDNPNWNILGIMNNSWYRVQYEIIPSPNQQPAVLFRHPVLPGGVPGGWKKMPVPDDPRPLSHTIAYEARAAVNAGRLVTPEEVAKHNKVDDCWIVINNEVYDVTPYMKDHPGGVISLLLAGGKDVSELFHEIHYQDAIDIKNYYLIGTLVSQESSHSLQVHQTNPVVLNTHKWIDFELIERRNISHDSRWFKFRPTGELPLDSKLGLYIGQHLLCGYYDEDDDFIVRPFTPIRPAYDEEDDGSVELIVKVYFPNERFPKGGKMSQYMETMNVGDLLKIKGPAGHVLYHGLGYFSINGAALQAKRVSMIAGGSGLTPVYQLISNVLSNPNDNTELSLIYANKSTSDILMRSELDRLAQQYPNRFRLWYVVAFLNDDERATWAYSEGFVNQAIIREHCFTASSSEATIAFLCGPPGLVAVSIQNLHRIGYAPNSTIVF